MLKRFFMEWIIYKHTNQINGKIYIGQTKQTPQARWQGGLGYQSYGAQKESVFSVAIKKYGWENFTHEILEEKIDSQEEADRKEIYWIEFFRSYIGFSDCNGYNMTLGGSSGEHLGYSVYQISKTDMSVINEFASTAEASRQFSSEGNASQIRRCCEGLKHSCKGYYWCYKDNYTKEWMPKNNELVSPVLQIDDDLNVIRKYDSITECVKLTGFSMGSIVSCCRRKQRKANNYFWCYALEYSEYWKPVKVSFSRNEKIYCFETDKTYVSAKQASIETGANRSHILRCCKEKENGANGLHFCYARTKDVCSLQKTQKRGSLFTEEENALLKEKYPILGICPELLNFFPDRTSNSLRQQAHRLRLKYSGKSKHNKRVLCVELNKYFNSIDEAYRFLNLKDGSSIGRCCKDKRKTAGGYHWNYVDYK